MLTGIQLYRNMWHDVIAWRWRKGEPGKAEVVRANRRDFRARAQRWTITGRTVEDARKLSLTHNGLRPTSVPEMRADPTLPDVETLLRALAQRFELTYTPPTDTKGQTT